MSKLEITVVQNGTVDTYVIKPRRIGKWSTKLTVKKDLTIFVASPPANQVANND